MRVARVALKYFTFGLVFGLLFAPRAGQETRGMLISRVSALIQDRLGGTEQPGATTTL